MRVGGRRFRPGRRASAPPLLLLFTLLAGCGSDGTGPGDDLFFRFKVSGAQFEYTDPTTLFAVFVTAGAQSNVVIAGYDPTTTAAVHVYDDSPITPGTYSGYDVVNQVIVGILIHHEDAAGNTYSWDPSGGGTATATISEITSTRVRGTFSGVLSEGGQPDITVTEGSFAVQRLN
jgi:hypothetical protein